MKAINQCFNHSLEKLMPIVSVKESGTYVIRLPVSLQNEQYELEQMLNRLFAGHLTSPYNIDLAEQLSLNWCAVKARKNGLAQKCVCESTMRRRSGQEPSGAKSRKAGA
jgi:hypothetical protein